MRERVGLDRWPERSGRGKGVEDITGYLGSFSVRRQHSPQRVRAVIVLGSVAANSFVMAPERSLADVQDIVDISDPRIDSTRKRRRIVQVGDDGLERLQIGLERSREFYKQVASLLFQ